MSDIVDVEVVDEPSTELEVRPEGGLFRTEDPGEFLTKATATATALAAAVRQQRLVVKIGQGEHVKVEGWTMLGSLLGVVPVGIWTRKLDDGWEARVEARTLDGRVVGAAEAECLRSEKTWANRDDYALRSMAQTRATSKALRMPLGFVMTLAGFEATPFEEMPPADELAAEQQRKRSRGGLTSVQKKLYAAFKQREEEGKATQGELKDLLTQAGAEDLAHATPEQCEQVIEWLGVDVPFDTSLPAQDQAAGTRPAETHGRSGTGGEGSSRSEALEARRVELTDKLLELRPDVERHVAANRQAHADTLASHLTWLEDQLAKQQAAMEESAQEEIPV